MSEGVWTDERVATLKRLWAEGASGSEMAMAVGGGASRSACIGKAHRLGLPKRETASPAGRPRQVRAVEPGQGRPLPIGHLWKQDAAARLSPSFGRRCKVVSPDARPWIEREFGQCAFPVDGEGADVFSCCNPVDGGLPYCRGHFDFMHQPRDPQPIADPRTSLENGKAA